MKKLTIRFEIKSRSNDGIQLEKLQIKTHRTHVREWIIFHHSNLISLSSVEEKKQKEPANC